MYGKALNPFLDELSQKFRQSHEDQMNSEQEGFRRWQVYQQELERKRKEQEAEERRRADIAAKVLEATGSLPPDQQKYLAGTPYMGMLTPDGALKKSPEALETEELNRQYLKSRAANMQAQAQGREQQMKIPQLLQQVFEQNPNASYEQLGPMLVGMGAMTPQQWFAIQQRDKQFNRSLGQRQSQFNAVQERLGQPKPLSPSQQRVVQQGQLDDSFAQQLADMYRGMAEEQELDPLQFLLDPDNVDERFPHSEDMLARVVELLRKR